MQLQFFFLILCLCSCSFKFFRIIYLCSYSFFLPELILHKFSVEGYSCRQSGEICQVVSAGAFTLLCYAFWFSLKGGCSPCCSVLTVLPTRCLLDVSRLSGLTLRPSAPVCCCLPDFLGTWEAGIFAGSRVWSSSLSPRLVLHMMTCVR